ncbi:MAG: hypothetical protein C5B51_18685 [Terriglobia bacterium]|nr:MAG: hypothetical protein C5B51_18685 [Terriglobia bacterium]
MHLLLRSRLSISLEGLRTKRDIFVVGASTEGVTALQELVTGLAPDFPGCLLVVVHFPPWHRSELPAVLNRSGRLPALQAEEAQRIEAGHIYVAPPDYHLLVEQDELHLWRGPKENMHRPAINALFRSAAVSYKERVAGIILSGAQDDGATGLWWIKHFNGVAIVQDPGTAAFPDMPLSALDHVPVDYVMDVKAMGPLLTSLAINGRVQWTGEKSRE